MPLELKDLNQVLIDADATYISAVHHRNKSLLIAIIVPLKILTGPLQDHQTHSFTALNINLALKVEATIKTHRFQKSKNHMADILPPPTTSGSRTMTSSSDVCLRYKMNIHLKSFPKCCLFSKSGSDEG